LKTPTKTASHCVYNLNYHIVLMTKYRNKVLMWRIEEFVKEQIPIICQRYEWETLALEVMPEHVHLFVSAPPTIAPNTKSAAGLIRPAPIKRAFARICPLIGDCALFWGEQSRGGCAGLGIQALLWHEDRLFPGRHSYRAAALGRQSSTDFSDLSCAAP